MKGFLYIIPVFTLLISCNKFNEFKESETANFDSEEKMTVIITGVYDRLKEIFTDQYISTEDEPVNGYDWYQLPNSKGDDFNHSEFGTGYYELIDSQFVYNCTDNIPTHEPLYEYKDIYEPWNDYYNVITTLNTLIINAEKQDNIDSGMKKILGEAYLLRAYTYFRLVRVYGEIPLIKDTQVNYNISKSTFEDIYDFIENNLETAIDLLPENKEEARIPQVTPHKGTAKAILAEVYLTRAGFPLKQTEYYAMAAETAGEVIDNASGYGFAVLPDFSELWNDISLWNEETVFALHYTRYGSRAYGGGSRIGYVNNISVFGLITIASNYSIYVPGRKFYNHFPKSYRKQVTFYSLLTEPYSIESMDDNTFIFIETDTMDLCTPIYYNKFEIIPTLEYNSLYNLNETNYYFYWNSSNTLYIYRYAQTMLTFAEAKARSGQPDAQAYEAVNIIRRRAHHVDLYSPSEYDLTPGLSAEQFADSVVWERAWELCAEPEGRWFDLMRLEMVEDLPSLRDENDMEDYPEIITKDFYFSSIPESEIDFNKNLGPN